MEPKAQTLAANLEAPSLARRFVSSKLPDHLPREVSERVLLCTSELVTNAVTHGHSDAIGIAVALEEDQVTVEVVDDDASLPEMRAPDPWEPSGRGLRIVEALATRWGFSRRARGKSVWATVPLHGGRDTARSGHCGRRGQVMGS